MFKIEKNIPVKEKGGLTKFISQMEIGDSFLLSEKDRGKIYQTAKQLNFKLKSSKQEKGTVRVWRIF